MIVKSNLGFFLVTVLLAGLVIGAPLFGQSQAINGSIRGRITDPADAPVPQANVNVTNTQTGLSKSTESSEDGYYVSPICHLVLIRSPFRSPGSKA